MVGNLRAIAIAPQSVQHALKPLSFAIVAVAIFSFGINILMLVSPLYLMQVFDRVLSSSSLPTLFWLSVVAIGCMAVYGALEIVRGRLLSKIGIWLECEITGRLVRAGMAQARAGERRGAQSLRDLAQVRGFLSGPSIHAVFDAPWAVVFLIVLTALHPWFGIFAAVSAVVLLVLAFIGDIVTRQRARRAGDSHMTAYTQVESAFRNAEVAHAMGMTDAILDRWAATHAGASFQQDGVNDKSALFGGISKFLRMSVQVAILGIGAMLAVQGEVTGGAMIAASILLGRALAPIDQVIAGWHQMIAVRSAWRRVNEALQSAPQEQRLVSLPEPKGHLSVEDVALRFAGANEPIVKNISFELQPGESLAIVGPSGAGKSLLCKLLTGIVAPSSGHVRIDHADLSNWPQSDLRPYVGYLPQEISLFPGLVGENIARLGEAEPRDIIGAAQLADVHELILRLPNGYQTDVGEFGHLLSGGQRQRIGLARAVFGSPRLVVLDEPNSNLDPAGEAALVRAIGELKARQCTVVVVSHKLSVIEDFDKALLLQDGEVKFFGPAEKIIPALAGPPVEQLPSRPRAVAGAAE